jgi:tetraacyldisaccharide 4'-kinase
LIPVFKNDRTRDIPIISSMKPSVLLVSGIANPEGLKHLAGSISDKLEEIQFSDHHIFTKKDITKITRYYEHMEGTEKILITTEKDAVRLQKYSELPENLKRNMFYIPIIVEFLNEGSEPFNNQIINYVRENQRNR